MLRQVTGKFPPLRFVLKFEMSVITSTTHLGNQGPEYKAQLWLRNCLPAACNP